MKRLLIIFIKTPVIGQVKTRLAADTSNEKAFRIYLKLMEQTEKACHNLPFDKVVYYSGNIEYGDIWKDHNYYKKQQHGNDLGEKMYNAFYDAFNAGYHKVCIIGSDCFEMSEYLIYSAFDKLNATDVVIGPSTDGGYYLLGMRHLYNSIFENKPWSESHLMQGTIEELQTSNISYELLPPLTDIDTLQDIVQPELLEILSQ